MNPFRLYFDHTVVFPFSYENFDALISFYFKKNGVILDGPKSIDRVFSDVMVVSLGEFEFLVKCIQGNFSFFRERLNNKGMTISNLCMYGLDAYLGNYVGKTSNRSSITNDFRSILKIEIIKLNGNTSLQTIPPVQQ